MSILGHKVGVPKEPVAPLLPAEKKQVREILAGAKK